MPPFREDLNVSNGTYSRKYSHNGHSFILLHLLRYYSNSSTANGSAANGMMVSSLQHGSCCNVRINKDVHSQSSKAAITRSKCAFQYMTLYGKIIRQIRGKDKTFYLFSSFKNTGMANKSVNTIAFKIIYQRLLTYTFRTLSKEVLVGDCPGQR